MQADTNIAAKIELPGRDDPKADILRLVYNWLWDERNSRWLIILDNADDDRVFSSTSTDSDGAAHGAEAPREAPPLESLLPQVFERMDTGHFTRPGCSSKPRRDEAQCFSSGADGGGRCADAAED
ncbi:uncharacterized protein BP5553_07127 [Venustampulla echinocandica]|uniref:Uncharacterized protein n=1 Tax=Venustampulla echinocandica TaxID=2656787 RepID=A0A370TIK8_9HELO|nr:uncharacterized protein BP5553_07127 [Venustampulla echinocandica]RDL35196.1 hypothetical protein BP5553_07127 [Venustampulla echinocandica]